MNEFGSLHEDYVRGVMRRRAEEVRRTRPGVRRQRTSVRWKPWDDRDGVGPR